MPSFMNRTAAYLIGPELIWILMFAVAGVFVAVNQPISSLGHWKVMFSNLFLPAIGVMLAFAPLFLDTRQSVVVLSPRHAGQPARCGGPGVFSQ